MDSIILTNVVKTAHLLQYYYMKDTFIQDFMLTTP